MLASLLRRLRRRPRMVLVDRAEVRRVLGLRPADPDPWPDPPPFPAEAHRIFEDTERAWLSLDLEEKP